MTDEPAQPTTRSDAALAERYEELRAAALGGGADGWRLGLGVLTGKGVVGWIRAWTTCPAAPQSPAATVPRRPPGVGQPVPAQSGPARSGPDGTALVRVLAAMALAHA